VSGKSEHKAEHKILARALQSDEFPWDYSYTPWHLWPRDVRREFTALRNVAARTWIHGKTTLLGDARPSR
jgi:hypothetical protein